MLQVKRLAIGVTILSGIAYSAVKYSNYSQRMKFNEHITEFRDTFKLSEPEIANMQKRIGKDYTVNIKELLDSLNLDKKLKDRYSAGAQSIRDSIETASKIK